MNEAAALSRDDLDALAAINDAVSETNKRLPPLTLGGPEAQHQAEVRKLARFSTEPPPLPPQPEPTPRTPELPAVLDIVGEQVGLELETLHEAACDLQNRIVGHLDGLKNDAGLLARLRTLFEETK